MRKIKEKKKNTSPVLGLHKVDLRTDNQGSTLMLVIISLLVVGIAVVAFQTSVASFATRTLTQHYEKQAYLSARSVANAVVEKLGTLDDGGLSSAETELLNDLCNLAVSDVDAGILDTIDLGTITFDGVDDLDTGDVEVTIIRTATNTYEVEAVADVNGDVDSVTVVLSASLSGSTSGQVEVSGSWSGFYTDFGVGLTTGSEYTMNDTNDTLVLGTASYIVGGSTTASQYVYGDVYSDEDLIYNGITFQNGSIQTEGNITLEDNVTVTNSNKYMKASGEILVSGTGVTITSTTYSDTLTITGDGTILQTGPYVANTIIIDADNVVITGEIICENLYITGDSIRIEGTVYADNIYTNVTNPSFTGSISAGNVVVQGGTAVSTIQTPADYVSFASRAEYDEIVTLASFSAINRTKPSWAEKSTYENIIQTYDDSTITSMSAGDYYYIDSSNAPVYDGSWINLTTKTVDGEEWDVLRVSNWSATPIYIVVQDGQNLEVLNSFSGVYFILEGNAKLKFSSEWGSADVGSISAPVRIYAEAVSTATYNAIEEATQALADQAAAGLITYEAMSEGIEEIMTVDYWDDMAALIIEDSISIYGSTIVPYVKIDGSGKLTEVPYSESEDGYLSDDDASQGGTTTGSGSSSGTSITFDVDAYK